MRTFKYPPATDITKTPAHQENAKHKRILIVEDNQLNSKLLKHLLTAHGYEVVESPGGLRALDLARDERPDLILMDLRLPDINGLEVTRLLKQDERTKTIPIIAVTALASPDYEKRGFESGCDAFIPKPIILVKFLRVIELLFERPARDPDDLRIR